MSKDVLYDTMNREDLNWRKCHELIACKATSSFRKGIKKAFVVDDSVVQRFGKKMPGISSHFDHTTGRHMMGQQVLTLGLSCDDGFVSVDNELFTSKTKVQVVAQKFKDRRCTVAKRHRAAVQQTKPEMVACMIRRALRAGIEAQYFLADAWFGSKAIINHCYSCNFLTLKTHFSKVHHKAFFTGTLIGVGDCFIKKFVQLFLSLAGKSLV